MGLMDRILQNGISQDDLELMHEKGREEGYEAARKVTTKACYAAAASVLKRDYGFDKDKLVDFLMNMELFVGGMMQRMETADEVLDMIGVDILSDNVFSMIRQRATRPVLCGRCLYGDPVSQRTWDCDMLDGITSGKTECKHYKES